MSHRSDSCHSAAVRACLDESVSKPGPPFRCSLAADAPVQGRLICQQVGHMEDEPVAEVGVDGRAWGLVCEAMRQS